MLVTRRVRRLGALALLMTATTGCYTHHAVSLEEISAGDDVRVRVTAQELDRLEAEHRMTDRVFRGTVVQNGAGLLLQVPVPGSAASPMSGERLYNRVSLAPGSLVEVEIRELDKVRSFGLVAAGVVALGAAGFAVFESPDEGEGNEKPNDNEDLFVIGIPFSFGW